MLYKYNEPFRLSTRPDAWLGFYCTCGPCGALGFFVAGLPGFITALSGDLIIWLLLAWRKKLLWAES